MVGALPGPLVQSVDVWSSFALGAGVTALAALVAIAGRSRMLAAA